MTDMHGYIRKTLAALPFVLPAFSGAVLAAGFYVPQGNAYYALCRQAALAGTGDEVLYASMRAVGDTVRVRLLVGTPDGSERVVVCDGPTGKILKNIALDD